MTYPRSWERASNKPPFGSKSSLLKSRRKKIHPVIFKQIHYILETLTYLDDLSISSSIQDIREYQRARDPLLPSLQAPGHGQWANVSPLACDNYFTELKLATAEHQACLITGILRILSFCHCFLH